MTTLICNCNETMPLDAKALGAALSSHLKQPQDLKLHSLLCRRQAPEFQRAIVDVAKRADPSENVVVACTQEQRLFSELALATEGAQTLSAPIKFINIRESGGWSKDASKAMPKLAALLAAAHLPDPEPVSTVTYKSAGRLLIVGELEQAEATAALLGDSLDVTIFASGSAKSGAQNRDHTIMSGTKPELSGWLGAFKFEWQTSNPIDLDLCTRCNACVVACPEGAIGLDYQIDMNKCQSHRACVKACDAAGAIDFGRAATSHEQAFDVVLDLSAEPLIDWHAPPQGYFKQADTATLMKLQGMVGEFEKPKFFNYKQKICAHSRNTTVGCNACVEVCSAHAISSDTKRQQIVVNPNLCVGCGACTTVCPTGALTYTYPRATDQGTKLKTLLTTYAKAGGKDATLLLHSQTAGQQAIEALGRAAQLKKGSNQPIHGVPHNVIPVALWHTASTGIEMWLSSICLGASKVAVMLTSEEAPDYVRALTEQMAVAQSIMTGLGYVGKHLHLIQSGAELAALDAALQATSSMASSVPSSVARFGIGLEKRATLEMALDHLMQYAPLLVEPSKTASPITAIALPTAGSPLGTLNVNTASCTMCLSCVSSCPAGALKDNSELLQLQFIEKNCVQCGLCEQTCPENAIQLVPQLLLTTERKEARALNTAKMFHCIRCAKPFGTEMAITQMFTKLVGHSMFQGAAAERLKMCMDCRVIDLHSADNELKIK
jgi:ferredoxin